MKMKTREKIFKGVSLFSGLILIINMSAAGVFFIPSSVNANEVDIDTCANNAGDNSGGECPSPDWDKSSLVFDNGYACQGDCHEIAAKVCNLGDEDMDGTSSYEVWFNASGNPKDGAEAAGGEISALKVGECQVLTYLPSQNGNYKFRAMQRPGHSGQGDLWSESCENINIDECQGIDCGNNIKEDGEECDEGQDNGQVCVPSYNSSCKYCSDECQIIELTDGYCGNSIIENDEQCDGPAGVGQHQICNQDCDLLNLTYCGDGAKQTPNAEGTGGPANDGNEACDGADGTGQNQICSPECILINIEFCGDGINNDNEECDANGQNGQVCAPPYGGSCDYCSGVCQNVHLTGPYCGDGIKNGTEQCDGADGTPLHYTCTQACVLEYVPYCGDGIKNGTEECDDGNQIDSDECKNNCTLPTVCANDLDVMIVFDRSGSMGYDIPTRISQAKTAANTFLDKLRTGDQSGLVSYSTTATLNKTLSNSHSATKTAINSLIASGATNIGDAINLATGENISVRANPQAIKIQILLTDGKANKPYGPGNGEWPADVAYAKAKADEAAINGIKIFTIGLGSDVNASMLQYIASTTGGQYYFAPTGVDLQNIFNQIAYRACQFGSISGCKYNDTNNDGNISGEPKLSGWKINLSGGVNLSQSTDQSGCYTFAGLSAGNYTVAEDPIQPYNFIQTYPANPNNYLIALADGQNTANKDFGNYIVECGNGQLDQGEECDGTVGVGSHQSCDSDCTLNNLTYCGDGAKQTPNDEGTGGPANDGNESCDGQSGVPANYTCAQNCVLEYVPYCGDGQVNQTSEECDANGQNGQVCAPNYGSSCSYCSSECANITLNGPYCGDGIVNGQEQCDGPAGVPAGFICDSGCILEETICSVDLDVMIVMDRSGSMGYEIPTRLFKAKTAANGFLNNLRTNDQSGLVSYSTTAALAKTLSNNHSTTQTLINGLTASGATNIGDAINSANNELISARANPQAIKMQILLTDGKANKPYGPGNGEWPADVAYAKAKADEAAINGIKIFTIGLGSDVNASMLQYIASTTGGGYHFAPTGAELDAIFNQISVEACNFGSISGCKYSDFDGNMTTVDDRAPVADWEINLVNTNYSSTQLTSANGCYNFTGLEAGIYTISESLNQTSVYQQLSPINPNTFTITIGASENATGNNFINYIPACGNSIIDAGEQCDNLTWVGPHQSCSPECALINLTYCGDSIIQIPNDEGMGGPNNDGQEQCDGQSGVPANYTCAQSCILEYVPYCGDGIVNQTSEECDGTDGVGENQTCTQSCTLEDLAYCGDGIKNGQEECDGADGVGQHQSCNQDCTLNNLTYCGDGAKQTPNDEGTGGPANDGNEACDGADGVGANQLCSQTCALINIEYCGDGLINDSEECDDGNTANGDGCSSICANEPAPAPITIVINEIMKDPAAVSDTNGEWFEVYNTSTSSVDLLGCIIKDNGTNTHTIFSSLVVPALGYAVLARNASSTLNGGFNPDYAYSNFQLGNDSDEIILTCDNAIIDMVAYDNGATFPDPTGKSMILNNPANDNNIGGNWCVSSSSYGNGDLGTPGQANDSCGGEPLLNSIKVCKYSDLDSNTETTADQTPIGNWGFSLYNGQATTTQATAGDGCITFASLADGSYTITEENKSGWIMLDPASGQQVVNVSGGQNSVLNFYNMELLPEPYCGDGIVSGDEACDGSAGVPAHYVCTNQCALEYLPYCGDGVVSGAEECDGQAGVGPGQICTASCLVETSFTISGGPLFIINTAHGFLPESEPIVLGEEGAPQILISKIVNKDKVNPGDEIEYTVEVKNIGNLTAFNVILSDILPDGFIFADSNKTSMNWQLGDITAGNSINTSYKVLIGDKVADGIYANLAQASADNNKNVTDSVNVKVGKPQVLGAELAGTGFNNYELAGIIILIVLLFLMSSLLKRKYNN